MLKRGKNFIGLWIILSLLVSVLGGVVGVAPAQAASNFQYLRDVLVSSAPGAPTSHVIQFEASNTVPASGRLMLTFPVGFGNINAINSSTMQIYVNGSPQAINGAVWTCSFGISPFILCLSNTANIFAGDNVEIRLGVSGTPA